MKKKMNPPIIALIILYMIISILFLLTLSTVLIYFGLTESNNRSILLGIVLIVTNIFPVLSIIGIIKRKKWCKIYTILSLLPLIGVSVYSATDIIKNSINNNIFNLDLLSETIGMIAFPGFCITFIVYFLINKNSKAYFESNSA